MKDLSGRAIIHVNRKTRKIKNAECIPVGTCADTCPKGIISSAWTEKRKPGES